MQILVVDDDAAGRYLVSSILSTAGHEAVEAENGYDALEKARTSVPDAVITDILMPQMDGYQLAREWKSDPTLCTVPLIFLTASYTDPKDKQFAIDLGADGFLSKPVDPDVLVDTVTQVCAEDSAHEVRRPADRSELEVLQRYGERVVHKLEEKLADLERANALLENTMAALSAEVEARGALVSELSEEVARREQRELELHRERDFTERIMRTADVFMVAVDRDRKITLFSGGAERISGYSADEVLGRDYVELFSPPGERQRRMQLHEALFSSDETQRMTSQWVMKSGGLRVIDWSISVLGDERGEPTGMIRFGIDATERSIVTATERVMGVVDLAVLLDRPLTEVLDLACAQAAEEYRLAGVWIRLSDGHGDPPMHAAGPAAPRLGEVFATEASLACPLAEHASITGSASFNPVEGDLPARWLEVAKQEKLQSAVVIPVRAHERVIGCVGAAATSAHGLAEPYVQALELLADRLGVAVLYSAARDTLALQSAALESAADAIAIADISGRVSWVNPAFESMTGWSAEDAVGQELLGKGPGYHEPAYEEAWARLEQGHIWRAEMTNHMRDGTEYVEDVTIAPVKDDAGQTTHVVIVKQDVSERARLERLKSDFVSMVSHELRTPLTTIIGYADLLSVGVATLDAQKLSSAAESIRASGNRMKGIVEQLLEVNQIQAEGVRVETAPFDMGHLVTEVAQSVPRSDRHRLNLDIPDDLPTVDIDARRISHALRNIIDNAVKYSPEGGTISIAITEMGDEMVISVTDEGVGMGEDELPTLFDAFTQQDMSSTRSFGGIGMGLFVAYQFVAAHGGRITVRSRKNHGSTFEIRLPIKRA